MIAKIVGSRDFNNYSQFHYVMDKISTIFAITGFVSGGAKRADSFVELYAKPRNIPIFVRNGDIIPTVDIVIAFWDGKSRGTRNSINKALTAKKNCFVFSVYKTKTQI